MSSSKGKLETEEALLLIFAVLSFLLALAIADNELADTIVFGLLGTTLGISSAIFYTRKKEIDESIA
ncbi:MAG: hypothetical protein ACW98K_11860 [Candidatus Kariarchaeaceae archaeon]|jgi:hypothetical protein